jgi:aminoglycoside phosphotransferase (APT) family kinase protein
VPIIPAAEVEVTAELVRGLLSAQAPALLGGRERMRRAAAGWDSEMWRLGDDLVVRLPRRAAAAPLIRHEQQALPAIAQRLAATGVAVPAPVFAGTPSEQFPWPWSVAPWFEGDAVTGTPRSARTAWAATLARALVALHADAPPTAPRNPVRGVPLAERDEGVRARMSAASADLRAVAVRRWEAALAAPPWTSAPVWIHGDLHPGNLVARDGALRAIVDFGDVTSGDPAYDLAVGWLAFDRAGRERFAAATGERYDAATWTRAAGWAAAIALLLLAHGDEDPAFAAEGRTALRELA